MAKTVALKIEIDGLSDITKNVVALEDELKSLNDELKKSEQGSDAYIELRNSIAVTTEELKKAKKEQRDFVKEATKTKAAEGSYIDLQDQLSKLKKEYKNLSAAERDAAKGTELQQKIQGLDTELKKIDSGIGQFQRNVGNYPRGIGRIVKSLEQLVPGFENFSKQITNAEGKLNGFGKALIGGFLAFQAAKYIGQAVKQLDEFISKINETRETVATFSGAYGEQLDKLSSDTTALAETFNTDAESISAAAQSLAKSLGISFDEALGQLEGALVEGRGNADDYLKTIEEYPEGFQAASGAVTEFSERNRQLLDTNKELATSQIDVAKRLTGLNDTFKTIGSVIKTVFLTALANIIDFLRPIYDSFVNLFSAIGRLTGAFSESGKKISVFTLAITALSLPFKVIGFAIQLLVDGITYLVDGFNSLIERSPFLQTVFAGISAAVNAVYEAFNNLPFVFAGIVAAIRQLGINFANFFKKLAIDTDIFINQVANKLGAGFDDYVKQQQARSDALSKEGKTIGKAYADAFNEAKAAADKRAADIEAKQRAIEAEKARAAANVEDAKTIAERIKAQREAAKKLAQERQKYVDEEIKQERSRAALLADLQAKVIDASIKNIQDEQARKISEINRAFEVEKHNFEKQTSDLKLAQEEREKQLSEVFGKNSKEVQQSRIAFNADIVKIQEEQAAILAQSEINKNAAIAKVTADFRKKELDEAKKAAEELRAFRDKALSDELNFIDDQAKLSELKNKENLNELLALTDDAVNREKLIRVQAEQDIVDQKAVLINKLQALNDAEEELNRQASADGVEIKQDEYDAILLARQQLNTDISDLELQQTAMLREQSEQRKKDLQKGIEDAAGYFTQGLDLLDQFIDNANAKEEERLNAQAESSQKRQDQISAEIDKATGLRKKFLQQQLKSEAQNAEAIAVAQEEAARKAANADKAIAITQSIIQGLLAVSRAAAAPPGFPLNAGAVIGVGVLAAAQTAAIASKKFADGGLVNFADGGVIKGPSHAAGGVPFTVRGRAGFEAEGGEFIVKKSATAKFLPVLNHINTFADGGLIGGIPSIPSIVSDSTTELIRAFNQRSNAIANMVVNTKVTLSTYDLEKDNTDKDRIEKNAKLGA